MAGVNSIQLVGDNNVTVGLTKDLLKQEPNPKRPLLDANTEYWVNIICYVAICVLVGAFGTVANIINIIIYVRMGISTTASNLNLFSLAVGDLGVCFTTFLHGAGFIFIIMDIKDLPFEPFGVVYYVVGFPLIIFTIVIRILTAYVALERCLCVVFPFRIRTMFSIKRCTIYIIIIYFYATISHVPLFIVHRLEIQEQPGSNLSRLVMTHTPERDDVYIAVHYLNNLTVTMATIAVVFVSTVVTSSRIKTSKAWRKSVSGGGGGESKKSSEVDSDSKEDNPKSGKLSDERIDREMRLVKMITANSLVYLVCYIPDFLIIVMRAIDEDIQFRGAYFRLAQLTYSFALIGCVLNSSVNVFIYFRMSTRYRQEFYTLFGRTGTKG